MLLMVSHKAHAFLLIAVLAGGVCVYCSNPSGGIPGSGAYHYTRQQQLSQESQWYAQSGKYDSQQQQSQLEKSEVEGDDETLPPLPPGWSEHYDPASGQMYYYNSEDGTTTWDRPASVGTDEGALTAPTSEVEEKPQSVAYQDIIDDRGDQSVDQSSADNVVSMPQGAEEDSYGDVKPTIESYRREDSETQEDKMQHDLAGWDSQQNKGQGWDKAKEVVPNHERPAPQQHSEEWRHSIPNPNQQPPQEWRNQRDAYDRDDASQQYSSFRQNPTASREVGSKPAGWNLPVPKHPEFDKHEGNPRENPRESNHQQPLGNPSQEEMRNRFPPGREIHQRQQPYRPQIPAQQYAQGRPGSHYAPQNPYNQYPPHGQGSLGGGSVKQPAYRPQGQMVPQQQQQSEGIVKEALNNAWRGILGFGNRTRDVVESVGESVVSGATGAGRSISSTGAGLWGQAWNSIGSVFEGGEKAQSQQQSQYSLSGYAENGQQGYKPGYPPQQQRGYPPRQQGYPPQQRGYPPQQRGYPPQQRGYPPQQGYPPHQRGSTPQQRGYPPQQRNNPHQQTEYPPRKDQPNPMLKTQQRQQGRDGAPEQNGSRAPPGMQPRRDPPYSMQEGTQYREPPMQSQWNDQSYTQRSYPGVSRGMPPEQEKKDASMKLHQGPSKESEKQDQWSHPGLQSDY